ncbi:hypothetical protein HY495_02080 [Candidatus Woesearchaeota archaeon]|nr:hypothetical protein [Candidatus Woesearchaeota archaeon]
MAEKYDIKEKDKLLILNYWLKNYPNNLLEIPESLKRNVTKQKVTGLWAYYQDLGGNSIGGILTEIEKSVKELEENFRKKKEQSFVYILKKHLKEQAAKLVTKVVVNLIGLLLGFLLGYFWK